MKGQKTDDSIWEIEKLTYKEDGFRVLKEFEGWKIGFLRYCERFSVLGEMERHLETDEVFVLLEGKAVLYTENENCEMKKQVLYNIPKGVWHHIVVSKDATVMVVENRNTTKENTEKRFIERD